MNDDVRKYIYGTLIGFILIIVLWVGFLYLNACGFTFTCQRGKLPVQYTPIPSLIPATLPVSQPKVDNSGKCQVVAVDLIGAWVSTGHSDTAAFSFNDINGNNCEATFDKDVRPLFVEANLWYPGSYSCATCHSSDIPKISAAQLDMSSYQGIVAGSKRAAVDAKGSDILGGGDWKSSLLYKYMVMLPVLPPGHAKEGPGVSPVVFAGKPGSKLTAKPTEAATQVPAITPTP